MPECLSVGSSSTLLGQKQRIQARLAQWLDAYERSIKALEGQDFTGLGCNLLRTYHTMANIMADVCLRKHDESVFDSYTNQFTSIINGSIILWKRGSQFEIEPEQWWDMSRSIVDIGWIPPLYYTALKCRIHRIRLQAIRLLETTSHREGIWDAKLAVCVAQKVMEMEEGDFYEDLDTADDFSLSSSPGLRDLSLPVLPLSYRIHEVDVVLSDDPMDSIFLFCRRKQTLEIGYRKNTMCLRNSGPM